VSALGAAPPRRDLLLAGAALALLAAGSGYGAMASLAAGRGDAAPLRRLGIAYLRDHRGEGDPRWLGAQLFGASQERPALARRLAERRARDLAADDIVVVEGWLLARSEARFCALLALTAAAA
jgi:hypothetical protein